MCTVLLTHAAFYRRVVLCPLMEITMWTYAWDQKLGLWIVIDADGYYYGHEVTRQKAEDECNRLNSMFFENKRRTPLSHSREA
jgi:hypothetical protein